MARKHKIGGEYAKQSQAGCVRMLLSLRPAPDRYKLFLARARQTSLSPRLQDDAQSCCELCLRLLYDVHLFKTLTMSDAAPAPAPAAAPAPAKSPKKKASKPKKPSNHPKYSQMIRDAVTSLKERGGSSRQALLKYIVANYNVGKDEKTVNNHLKLALRAGVKNGTLKQSKGTGASGSFRLGEKAEKAAAKPKAKKVKKPKAAKPKSPAKAKKPKVKKSPAKKAKSPAKKAAVKKPKSPAKKAAKPKKASPKKAAKKPAAKKAGAKKAAKK